jgi:phage tail sheath protein FI
MPVTPTYPGVYIEEIPSGVHPITGVATSIAAFVDTFQRGPLDYAVLLGMADFERLLGGLDTTSEASYAIQQFFLNGGTEAYAVRVAGPTAAEAKIDVPDAAGVTVFTAHAGQIIGTRTLDNKGSWGNLLLLEVDYDTSDPTTLFNVTITEVDSTGKVLQSEIFRNLKVTIGDRAYVLDVVNSGSRIVYLKVGGSTNRPAANGTVGGGLPVPPVIPADGATCTITPTGGSSVSAKLVLGGATPADYPSLRPFLENAIRAAAPNNSLFSGATVQLWGTGKDASHPYFFRVLAGRGGPSFDPNVKLTFTDAGGDTLATALHLNSTAAPPGVANVQQYKFAGGVDDTKITDVNIRGLQATKTGFYALDDVDLFNILCIPAATTLTDTQVRAIISEATTYCDARRAMFIIDLPKTVNDVTSMQAWMTPHDGLRDRNLAIYFPRVRIPDPLNGGRLRDVGPSGTLAGIWAATDVARGVWKAPAGVDTQLRNVSELVYNLVDRENGVLNPLGINCLRSFPVYGNVSWGARTLYGADVQASEWKYIPVRRLALFLEESLFRGTKWVVFEPNDEPLWAQIRLSVGAFLQDLFLQGAFQGRTPEQAYLVKCDAEINTQYEVDRGIVNILVGFAPLKPAEFVIIKIQQRAAQTST